MMRIVVLGDLNLDILARIRGDLTPGDETRDRITVEPGGSAGTFARTAASAGFDVTFIGAVGRDLAGDLLERSLADIGVTCKLRRVDMPSGTVLGIERDGERSMICSRSANDGLSSEWVHASWPESPAHVHVSGYALLSDLQRPAVVRALELAREVPASVSIDPPPASLIRAFGVHAFAQLLPEGAWLFPNQSEGKLLADATEPDAVVRRLRRRFPIGAVTLGDDGALAWDADGQHRHAADRLDAVNTTGAGDVYAATFVTRYLETGNLAQANVAACTAAGAMLRARQQSATA